MAELLRLTSIKAPQEKAELVKDENGYYFVTLGALNTFNSAGQYYTSANVLNLLQNKSGSLLRRINNGALMSETGHPKRVPGMTDDQFIARNMRIEETLICAHIKELVIEQTDTPSGNGDDKIILIKGWVKPTGPYAKTVEDALENPDNNIAFSIRSFTKNVNVRGVVHKEIVQIITWDFVVEPGISNATKWKTLGIESVELGTFDMDAISDGTDDINKCLNCSLEDHDSKLAVRELIKNFNNNEESILDKW